MKKLLLQSKFHWLMAVPTFFLSPDKTIGLTLLSTLIISLIVGTLIEAYQFNKEKAVKKKQLNIQYYLYSAVDILVTVAGGVLGYYLGLLFR
jgi:formate-dependent nitrite reductase membrane component NrfD